MKRSLPPLVAGLLLQASAFSQSSAPSSAPMAPGSAGASAGTGPFDSRAGSSTADVRLHLLSPDEKRIVFLADAEQDEVVDLYVVKPTGSLVVKLSNPAFAPGSTGVVDFRITPDGRRVLYLADHAAPRRYELYSASIDGVGRSRRSLARGRPGRSGSGPTGSLRTAARSSTSTRKRTMVRSTCSSRRSTEVRSRS